MGICQSFVVFKKRKKREKTTAGLDWNCVTLGNLFVDDWRQKRKDLSRQSSMYRTGLCLCEVLIATHYTLPGADIPRCVQIFARVNVRHCRWTRRVWISFCCLDCSSNNWRITWWKCVLHRGPPTCILLLWAVLVIKIVLIYSAFYLFLAHST